MISIVFLLPFFQQIVLYYYFTLFNTACLYECVYQDPTEKKPVYVLTCAVVSWTIMNKYNYIIITSRIPFADRFSTHCVIKRTLCPTYLSYLASAVLGSMSAQYVVSLNSTPLTDTSIQLHVVRGINDVMLLSRSKLNGHLRSYFPPRVASYSLCFCMLPVRSNHAYFPYLSSRPATHAFECLASASVMHNRVTRAVEPGRCDVFFICLRGSQRKIPD